MKAFAFYTESHKGLLDDFLIQSLPGDLELVLVRGAQKYPGTSYMTKGWMHSMFEKARMVLGAIEENDGECILHLDVDVQFFSNRVEPLIIRQLEGCDLVAQSDSRDNRRPMFCGGFFALRCCASTKRLFERVLELMQERKIHDQDALNVAIPELKLPARLLPSDQFWSPRHRWKREMPLKLPSTAVAHHANWCVGTDQKRWQLEEGRRSNQTWQGMERHGSGYGGKWILKDSLDAESIVYSVGVGEDISFDHSILQRYAPRIHAFDPTPRSIRYVGDCGIDRTLFTFHPFGLLDRDGEIPFSAPKNPAHVSHSIFDLGAGQVSLPVRNIAAVMKELGHDHIELLKLDVEGSEYAILEHLLSRKIFPRQVAVEFHDWLFPGLGGKTRETIAALVGHGYRLVRREDHDHTFAL